MNGLIECDTDPKSLSPGALAFLGDAVYGLLVRGALVCGANRPAGKLHALSTQKVNAGAQAAAFQKIEPLLTEDERDVFRRGRNAKTGGTPKNASVETYHTATGLETLFGWLYLKNETKRLLELFAYTQQK
jgi:ribonuclease-3 family protein